MPDIVFFDLLKVLDLKSLTWTKVEAKSAMEQSSLSNTAVPVSCAGHSLVSIKAFLDHLDILEIKLGLRYQYWCLYDGVDNFIFLF